MRPVSRFRAALLRWVDRLYAERTDAIDMVTDDPPLPLDPAEVGRQAIRGDAILQVADWLAVSGFADVQAGDRQQYAEWLLEQREAYERQGALR